MDPIELYIPPWTTDDAEDIGYTPTSPLTADDVQEALDELAGLSGEVVPGVDLNTAVPQTLVLDDVFTYDELSNNDNDWYLDADQPPSAEDRLVADTNRALPRGSVGDVVGTMSDNGSDGIYVIVDLGSGSSPWILERHPDFNTVEAALRNMVFAVNQPYSPNYSLSLDRSNDQIIEASNFSYAVEPLYASAYHGHVEGTFNVSGGGRAHAEGSYTKALGGSSHAEGNSTTAGGDGSHSEGGGSVATGDASHAEGAGTLAIGDFSHSEGYSSVARWDGSHAHSNGRFTSAGDAQHERITIRTQGGGRMGGIPPLPFPPNYRVAFRCLVIAANAGANKSKAFEVTGLIKIDGSGTHSLVGSTVTTIADEGSSGYTVVAGADADGLFLTVGGTISNPDRTVATIWFTEVGA